MCVVNTKTLWKRHIKSFGNHDFILVFFLFSSVKGDPHLEKKFDWTIEFINLLFLANFYKLPYQECHRAQLQSGVFFLILLFTNTGILIVILPDPYKILNLSPYWILIKPGGKFTDPFWFFFFFILLIDNLLIIFFIICLTI